MNIKKIAFALAGAVVMNGTLTMIGHSQSNAVGVFPNDFGPTSIDVSQYPPKMKMYYRLFLAKCSACHTIARPINSQYLELSQEEQTAAKKDTPEIFKNPAVWKIGQKIWSRYVHKMMSKPGSMIQPSEGKKIFEFLVYDSKARKAGANATAWKKNRTQLLESFKTKYPKDYARLFGAASSKEASSAKPTAQHS